jgi:hypothetical protein
VIARKNRTVQKTDENRINRALRANAGASQHDRRRRKT